MTRRIRIPLLIVICIILIIAVYGIIEWLFWKHLPDNGIGIASIGAEDTLAVPPRPGIQGIVITGPKIKDLVFEIDGRKAGLKQLDWRRLEAIDRVADVKIRARITEDGRLEFRRENGDIRDEGHPHAGRMIESVVESWAYTPYKTGTIRIWFNVGSKGRKLVIDKSGLIKKDSIPDIVKVYDGLLYYISDIEPSDVRYAKVKF
jgi:hypothetical protein